MTEETDFDILEYSTFRVPYEELNRKYRNGHRSIEKDLTKIRKIANVVKQRVANNKEPIPVNSINKAFSTLRSAIEEMRNTFEKTMKNELEQVQVFKNRIDYLNREMEIEENNDQFELDQMKRRQTARYSIWYLLRCGYIETAKEMIERYRLNGMVDIEVFEQCKHVRDCLLAKNSKPCLEWIDSHRSKLRKMNSHLEIMIRQQDVVELVEEGNYMAALEYVKKYCVPLAKNDQHFRLQTIMGIIGLSPNEHIHKYNTLKTDGWERCAKLFVYEMYRLYQLCTQSVFSMALQCGLAAHKTPQCQLDDRPPKEVKCYVCNPRMWGIADGLPNAHVTQSRILCSLTGEVCNDDNPPYLFPSGHVYSEKAIAQLRKGDMILCPKNNSLFPMSEISRLFFL